MAWKRIKTWPNLCTSWDVNKVYQGVDSTWAQDHWRTKGGCSRQVDYWRSLWDEGKECPYHHWQQGSTQSTHFILQLPLVTRSWGGPDTSSMSQMLNTKEISKASWCWGRDWKADCRQRGELRRWVCYRCSKQETENLTLYKNLCVPTHPPGRPPARLFKLAIWGQHSLRLFFNLMSYWLRRYKEDSMETMRDQTVVFFNSKHIYCSQL